MTTETIPVRCKHPLRTGAIFCHICGTASVAIHQVGAELAITPATSVKAQVPSATNGDLHHIRDRANAICLDAEVWNLQKEFVQHQYALPNPRNHRGAMVGAVCTGGVGTILFQLGQSMGQRSLVGCACLAAALDGLLVIRFFTQRRRFQVSRRAWLLKYERLEKNLFEKWKRLETMAGRRDAY